MEKRVYIKKITGFDYLWVALYAFAGVAFELVLMWIEGMFGIESSTYTVSQNILHWTITTIGWVLIGLLVIFVGKKTTGFDIWEHREKMKGW